MISSEAVYPLEYDNYLAAWKSGKGRKWSERIKEWVKARR